MEAPPSLGVKDIAIVAAETGKVHVVGKFGIVNLRGRSIMRSGSAVRRLLSQIRLQRHCLELITRRVRSGVIELPNRGAATRRIVSKLGRGIGQRGMSLVSNLSKITTSQATDLSSFHNVPPAPIRKEHICQRAESLTLRVSLVNGGF